MSEKTIDFLGKRKLAMIFSALLLLASIISLAINGLKLGVDFTGGTLVELGFEQAADLQAIRTALEDNGFGDATVQHFGTAKDVLIRIKPKQDLSSAQLSTQVFEAVNKNLKVPGKLRRVEFVGPQVGDELAEDGGLALLYSIFAILAYVAWRFEHKFSLGSVGALIHDVVITLGGFFNISIRI